MLNDEINALSKRNIIKLSNNFILSQINIKEISLNIFLMLLSEIDMEDEEFKTYDIALLDIEKKIGKKINRNQKELDKIIQDFLGNNICLYGEDDCISLCGECEIIKEDGILFMRLVINPVLKEELLILESNFTKINLQHILQLKGIYSKRMFMLLKKVAGLGHWKVDLETLHSILNSPKSYKQYDNFKSRVLTSSMEQINTLNDKEIAVSYSEEKRGSRKVKMLNFKINLIKKTKKKTTSLTDKEAEEKEKWRKACDPKTYKEEGDDNQNMPQS